MSYAFRVNGRIGKPVSDVFDAVVDPARISAYFVTTGGGASAPLVEGTTVLWWGNIEVIVDTIEKDRRIVLRWDSGEDEKAGGTRTTVEMTFEPLDDGGTMVTISEGAWPDNERGLKKSYGNCEGWTQMLCCLKAYVEYGINLREGYYPSEMRGEPARAPDI